jgi:hypothetical protein
MNSINSVVQIRRKIDQRIAGFIDTDEDDFCSRLPSIREDFQMVGNLMFSLVVQTMKVIDHDNPSVFGERNLGDYFAIFRISATEHLGSTA